MGSHSSQEEEEEGIEEEDAGPDLDEEYLETDVEREMNRSEALLWQANLELEIPKIA